MSLSPNVIKRMLLWLPRCVTAAPSAHTCHAPPPSVGPAICIPRVGVRGVLAPRVPPVLSPAQLTHRWDPTHRWESVSIWRRRTQGRLYLSYHPTDRWKIVGMWRRCTQGRLPMASTHRGACLWQTHTGAPAYGKYTQERL